MGVDRAVKPSVGIVFRGVSVLLLALAMLASSAGAVTGVANASIGTTTDRANVYVYDTSADSRLDVHVAESAGDGPREFGDGRERSASPSIEARATSTTSLARSNATEAGGVGRVNAVGGTHNCVSCAIAGDSTLAGNPASALNLHPGVPIPGGNAAIEAYAGASWRSVAGQSAIENELLAAGNGARGIVYGTNGKTAHVWNAIVQDGNVNFVDFQGIGPSGSAAFDGWTKFAFVRTG